MPVVFLLFLLALIPVFTFAADGDAKAGNGPPPALVVTAPVESGQPAQPRTFVGNAEPRYTAAVAAEVDGLVEELSARRGDRVTKGAVVARLRPYRVQLLLEEARAALQEVEARIAKAEADVRRAQQLFQDKFISEEELQGRETELSALRQSAHRNRATVAILQDRLERMTIRAPFAGRVVAEATEAGQWLQEGDTVVELADLSVIHVMVPIPEQHLSQVAIGSEAQVEFDALPGRIYAGRVSAVVPRADLAARTFPLEVSVANPDGEILAGMLARVTFRRDLAVPSLLVPKDAYVPRPDGGGYVVKIADGQAAIVPVAVNAAAERQFAVTPVQGELAAGDRVVIRGNERLRPGQAVREASSTEGKPAP